MIKSILLMLAILSLGIVLIAQIITVPNIYQEDLGWVFLAATLVFSAALISLIALGRSSRK